MSSAGAQGAGASFDPSISADGRHVAFDSDASNLVADDAKRLQRRFVRGPLR